MHMNAWNLYLDTRTRHTCVYCMTWFHGIHCTNRDYCSPNPCQNRGSCVERSNGYSCTCLTGYTGQNCETCVIGAQLQDGSRCVQQEEAANFTPIIIGTVHCLSIAACCVPLSCHNYFIGAVIGAIVLLIVVVTVVVVTVLAVHLVRTKGVAP